MIIKEKIIFWDWNGTLLDDAEICLWAMNNMLARRKMNAINLSIYKEIFGFPVIEYYKQLGFDFAKESFELLSSEFIETYNSRSSSALLVSDTEKVLGFYQSKGIKNIVLSAMQHNMLFDLINLNGIAHYFTDILGIDNIYAHSKSSTGINYVANKGIDPNDAILIGDTLHDFEVASEIGCKCILVAHGHQSEVRLKSTSALVVGSLSELLP